MIDGIGFDVENESDVVRRFVVGWGVLGDIVNVY